MPFRDGQRHPLRLRLLQVQDLVETAVLRAGTDKAFPAADHQVDRRQGASQQDGAGNHQARIDFLLDRQIRTEAEDQRLHQHAEGLRHGCNHAALVARFRLQLQDLLLAQAPAAHQGRQHTQRLALRHCADSWWCRDWPRYSACWPRQSTCLSAFRWPAPDRATPRTGDRHPTVPRMEETVSPKRKPMNVPDQQPCLSRCIACG